MTEAQIKYTAEIDERVKTAVTPDMSFAVPRSVVMEILEERDALREALKIIKLHLDADNEYSYRADDSEGAMDTSFAIAKAVLAKIGADNE